MNKQLIGLENYFKNNKETSIRDYVLKLDDKINIDKYSNDQLKQYIESNYNITFSKRNSKGKDYVNYNTFRKITGEVRTKKKIYVDIQKLFLEKKDQQRAKTYEEIKQLLFDHKLKYGLESLWKTADTEELCGNLGYSVEELSDRINLDMSSILEKYYLLDEKRIDDYMFNAKKALRENNLSQVYKLNEEINNEIFSKIGYKNLENLINASNVYTGKNKIILKKANSNQLETMLKNNKLTLIKQVQKELDLTIDPNDINGQMSKLMVLSDGEKMVTGSFDANGAFRTEIKDYFAVNDESIFNNIIKYESANLKKMSSAFDPKVLVLALKENYALVMQGNHNVSFEDLVDKYSKKIFKI
ncbi:MAG: hypothetical protein WC376_04190 [Candidatus Nanoarchaeia archaeon]|jgi:hypothetical protein